MRTLSIILFLSAITFSCTKEDQAGYTISLNLTGFEDSTKFKLLDLDQLEFIDSTHIINGKLEFKGQAEEPFSARIHTVNNKYLILWIENENILST